MTVDVVSLLSDLVSRPSVNPMGRDVSGPEFFEYQMTEYLEGFFRQLNLPYTRQKVQPLRDNIIARLDGDVPVSAGGKLVMLEAHQDTVPVDGMTIPPWTPTIRDGKLYGRGSCDIKGGMAAMLTALARLAAERPAGMPTIIMACSVNEEFGFGGVKRLPELWNNPGTIFPRRPDVAIVSEPTGLDVVVAHKGVVRWRCHARGRASHSSQPHLGDSALFRMARVLEALEIYQHDVVGNLATHTLCGCPTISVGTIRGGISVNTVPDECVIEIDRRCVPGENPQAAYQHALAYLRDCLGADSLVVHDQPFSESLGLKDTHNASLASCIQTISQQVAGSCKTIGVPYGTDAATIADAGVPAVVFGPGSIDQAHTCDEWIAIDQLQLASEVYYRFCRSFA